MSDETYWTKEDIYDEQIAPLMKQIIAICKEHQIPMVAQFQYDNDEEQGPGFCTTALPIGDACEKMKELARFVQPRRHVALAETQVTHPDGSKEISIRRIS
jgi:hypothetical protein